MLRFNNKIMTFIALFPMLVVGQIIRYYNPASSAGGNGTDSVTTGDNRAYVTSQAWADAIPADITTGENQGIWELQMLGIDTATCQIDNVITSSSYYISIRSAPGHTHNGLWTANAAGFDRTGDLCIVDYVNYLHIEGLQIRSTAISGSNRLIYSLKPGTNNVLTVRRCIITAAWTETASGYVFAQSAEPVAFYLSNNIIYNIRNGTTNCWVSYATTTDSAYLYNNTVVNCYNGMVFNPGRYTNNIFDNITNYANYGAIAASDYNIFGGGSHSEVTLNTHDHTGHTFTWVDSAGGDFHLSADDVGAIDLGTDLSADAHFAVTLDIDNQTRSGTWDAGADEYKVSCSPCSFDSLIIYDTVGHTGRLSHNAGALCWDSLVLTSFPDSFALVDYDGNDSIAYRCKAKVAKAGFAITMYDTCGNPIIKHDTITVVGAGPISYSGSPFIDTVGVAIATRNITNSGISADSISLQAALPAGYSLNHSTGAITGTPEDTQSATNYRVYCWLNGYINDSVNISLAVIDTSSSGVPMITSVSGSIYHDSTLTILGSNFGTKSSAGPYKSSFQNNVSAQNFQESGTIDTAWHAHDSMNFIQDTISRVNRATHKNYVALKYNTHGDYGDYGYSAGLMPGTPSTGKDYISWWEYLYDGFDLHNGTTGACGERGFAKWIRLNYGIDPVYPQGSIVLDTAGGYYTIAHGGYGNGHSSPDCFYTFASFGDAGGSSCGSCMSITSNTDPPVGEWAHVELLMDMGSNSPNIQDGFYELRVNNRRVFRIDSMSFFADTGWNDIQNILFGGNYGWTGPEGDTMYRFYGDFYLDGTHSRVVIGDSSNWDSCRYFENQIVESWGQTEITAKLNLGNFAIGDTAYVYVFNGNNNVSSGEPIVIADTTLTTWSGMDTISTNTATDGHTLRWMQCVPIGATGYAFAIAPRVGSVTSFDIWRSTDSMNTWTKFDSSTYNSMSQKAGITISRDTTITVVSNQLNEVRTIQWKWDASVTTRPVGIDAWADDYGIDHTNFGSYVNILAKADTGTGVALIFEASNGTPAVDSIKMRFMTGINSYGPIRTLVGRDSSVLNFWFEFNRLNWLTGIFHNYNGSGGSAGDTVFYYISKDTGQTSEIIKIDSTHRFFNPKFQHVGNDIVLAWAQTTQGSPGLYQNISTDSGYTWGSWTRIFASCGYGDPTSTYFNNTVYLAFRTDSIGNCNGEGGCSEDSRWWIYSSADTGDTWTKEDSLCTTNMWHEQMMLNGMNNQVGKVIALYGCQYDNPLYASVANETWMVGAKKYFDIDEPTTSYTLTVTDDGNGSTVPSGASSVDSGVGTAIAATPDPYFKFVNWSVTAGSGVAFADSTNASTHCTLSVESSTIQANFEAFPTYTITINITGTGTVDTLPVGLGGVSDSGTIDTIIATPGVDSSVAFTGDTTSTNGDTAFVLMDGNKTVGVTFTENAALPTVDTVIKNYGYYVEPVTVYTSNAGAVAGEINLNALVIDSINYWTADSVSGWFTQAQQAWVPNGWYYTIRVITSDGDTASSVYPARGNRYYVLRPEAVNP